MKHYKLFINNEWVTASTGQTFTSTCPANGEVLGSFEEAGLDDVDRACRAAREAFESGVWSRMENNERAKIMLKAADIMERRWDELCRMEALDTGKPIYEVQTGDMPYSIYAFRYFANLAREIKGEYIHAANEPYLHDYLVYEPYGVVGVISPYNFPLHLLTRSLAPALAAGNTTVCKASSMTPLTTAVLGEIVLEAGFPPGVVNIISGKGSTVGEALAGHKELDVVALTGSEQVGRRLLELSARSEIIKKNVLELGGKGPVIVEPDCRYQDTVVGVADGLLLNGGQVCCAQTRLILHESIYDRFLQDLRKELEGRKPGDILDPETRLGSMINRAQMDKVDMTVKDALSDGARLVCGGERFTGGIFDKGAFYKPTVLADVKKDMRCYTEEIFGPVLVVVPYSTLDEAIAMANNSKFGLGAGIFSESHKSIHYASQRLNAGSIFVNMPNTARMNAPFGGNRNSGIGREYGLAGLHEYLRSKNTIWNMAFGYPEEQNPIYF
jgi:acyl-CoA reductase-like NAD-dependent aldehyde dehydrogenase